MGQLRAFSIVGVVATLCANIAAAQQQSDSDFQLLFKQVNSPPNIAILLDDSGSMANAAWEAGFNQKKYYDIAPGFNGDPCVVRASGSSTPNVSLGTVNALTATGCPSNGKGTTSCPDNEDSVDMTYGNLVECPSSSFTTVPPAGSTPNNACFFAPTGYTCSVSSSGSKVRLTLPTNLSKSGTTTRWSVNYTYYILAAMRDGKKLTLPSKDRLETAKATIKTAINAFNPVDPNSVAQMNDPNLNTAKARFGLFSYNGSTGAKNRQIFGGTRAQLNTAIDALDAANWTPLAESLVDIARYMSGNSAIGVKADLTAGPYDPKLFDPSNAGILNPMATPSCAKNFVILLTDGIPTQDRFTHSPFQVSNESPGKNFKDSIGDWDKDGFDPDGPPGESYPNGGSHYLDDVAKYIFDNDLRPDKLKDAGGVNKGLVGAQNIVTYVVGFSVDSNLLKEAAKDGDGEYFTPQTAENLDDDIIKAIKNIIARSSSFSAASIPSTRTNADDALFTAYFEPSASGAFWAGHLQAYEVVQLPDTDPNIPDDIENNFEVHGKDDKRATDLTTGEFLDPRNTYFWDAQNCLNGTDPNCPAGTLPAGVRKLFFNHNTPATRANLDQNNPTAAELKIDPNELANYPNDPNTNLPWPTNTALAVAIDRYLRGLDVFDTDPQNNDPNVLRKGVLGDIFHSNPLAVGGVSFFNSDEPGFGPIEDGDPNTPPSPLAPSFFDLFYARQRVVFAGANDSFLHAFDGGAFINPDAMPLTGDERYDFGKGKELWGYMFRESLPKVKNLVKKGAEDDKPYFVDGSPAAADAWLPSSATDTVKDPNEWTTAMVTGMRNGGDAYVALDITDPNADPNNTGATVPHGPYPKLLWEFGDPNEVQGRSWSTPVITRVKLKSPSGASAYGEDFCGPDNDEGGGTSGNCREAWVVIFGGGYNSEGDPSIQTVVDPNSTAKAKGRSIFIVDLKSGKLVARAAFNAGDAQLKNMKYAIPSTPAVVDINFDGFADLVYVGDLGGQLWKWDISAVAQPDASGFVGTDQWPIARFFVTPTGTGGRIRQIFYPPSLSLVNGKLTLAFGTGERTVLEMPTSGTADDPNAANDTFNHFYVVRDLNPLGTNEFAGAPHSISELNILKSTDASDTDLTNLGFYVEAEKDQKFVTESTAFSGFVTTLSYDPDLSTNLPICERGGGSVLYIFNLDNGSGFFSTNPPGQAARRVRIGTGLPTSPRLSQFGDSMTVVVQTSTGRLIGRNGPAPSEKTVDTIFWRQR